jgi:hypothetical protein
MLRAIPPMRGLESQKAWYRTRFEVSLKSSRALKRAQKETPPDLRPSREVHEGETRAGKREPAQTQIALIELIFS